MSLTFKIILTIIIIIIILSYLWNMYKCVNLIKNFYYTYQKFKQIFRKFRYLKKIKKININKADFKSLFKNSKEILKNLKIESIFPLIVFLLFSDSLILNEYSNKDHLALFNEIENKMHYFIFNDTGELVDITDEYEKELKSYEELEKELDYEDLIIDLIAFIIIFIIGTFLIYYLINYFFYDNDSIDDYDLNDIEQLKEFLRKHPEVRNEPCITPYLKKWLGREDRPRQVTNSFYLARTVGQETTYEPDFIDPYNDFLREWDDENIYKTNCFWKKSKKVQKEYERKKRIDKLFENLKKVENKHIPGGCFSRGYYKLVTETTGYHGTFNPRAQYWLRRIDARNNYLYNQYKYLKKEKKIPVYNDDWRLIGHINQKDYTEGQIRSTVKGFVRVASNYKKKKTYDFDWYCQLLNEKEYRKKYNEALNKELEFCRNTEIDNITGRILEKINLENVKKKRKKVLPSYIISHKKEEKKK